MITGSRLFARLRAVLRVMLLWFLLPLAALVAVGGVTLYLLCLYKAEFIASVVEERLRSATSLPWTVQGPVFPVFSPSPGVVVENVRLAAASFEQEEAGKERGALFSVKSLRMHIEIQDVLRGNLRLSEVVLDSPTLLLVCDKDGCPLWLPLPDAEKDAASTLSPGTEADGSTAAANGTAGPGAFANGTSLSDVFVNEPLLSGISVNGTEALGASAKSNGAAFGSGTVLENGAAAKDGLQPGGAPADNVASQDRTAEAIASIAELLRSDTMRELPRLRLTNGTVRKVGPANELELGFTNVTAGISPGEEKPVTFSATFALPPADLEVFFSVVLGPGEGPVLLRGDLSGQVGMTPPPRLRTIQGDFFSQFSWQKDGHELRMPDFTFVAEGDSISADLTADTLAGTCEGPVQIHRLSLPRWFVFGRVLPPGLQQALDSLTGGFFFKGSTKGVGAFDLKGQAGELAVNGYVGTPDFSAPVVEVFLNLETANLDNIFPFLAPPGTIIPDPVSPEFLFPPLAPYPEDEAEIAAAQKGNGQKDEDGITVGYDVRIKVAKPIVHQVAGGPAEVLVFEHPSGATRVAFTGKDLLKGSASGYIDIEDRVVRMHYAAEKMQLALLPENQGSPVRISGVVTGTGDLTIAVDKKGNWADTWKLDVNTGIDNCELIEGKVSQGWRLHADKARMSGGSTIYTVTSKGVRIDGLWDLAVQGVHTSWNPKGKDAISGQFQGTFEWPPIKDGPPLMRNGKPVRQRKGLETLSGKLNASGSLIVPLGSQRVPIKGKAQTDLEWRVYADTITFDKLSLDGLGSYLAGKLTVDASGKDVVITAPVNFKAAPRTLLKEWGLLPSGGVLAPELVTGEARVVGRPNSILFGDLKLQVDGAPVSGQISGNFAPPAKEGQSGKAPAGSAGNHWTFSLEGDRLDLDKYFPPAPPAEKAAPRSTKPWDFSALQDFTMDATVTLKSSKLHGLHKRNTRLVSTLQKGRFSVQSTTDDLYGGKGTLVAQGTFLPEMSLVTLQRGLVAIKGMDLGKALYDLTKQQSYGGTADFIVDVKGSMKSDADIPAALSGIWSMEIREGTYPAFVGEASGLRNTFSKASVSGIMEKGVLKWDNFDLHGIMVDMDGKGKVDLVKRNMDFTINVTLAKVPSVPVRFHGGFDQPSMNVKGAQMVLNTAQNAGSTVLGIFTGVLELPGRALRGVGDLFGGKPAPKPPVKTSTQKEPEK